MDLKENTKRFCPKSMIFGIIYQLGRLQEIT